MTSLLNALKKLATQDPLEDVPEGGQSASPIDETFHELPEHREGPSQADTADTADDVGSDLDDATPAIEREPNVPRLFLNTPLKAVYAPSPRAGDDEHGSLTPSPAADLGRGLYHPSVASQPFEPRGADSPDVETVADERPVELVQSPFLVEEQHEASIAKPRSNQAPEPSGIRSHVPESDAAASRAHVATEMAENIPDLWQVLSRKSFDIPASDHFAIEDNAVGPNESMDQPWLLNHAADGGVPNSTAESTAAVPPSSTVVSNEKFEPNATVGSSEAVGSSKPVESSKRWASNESTKPSLPRGVEDPEVAEILRQCCTTGPEQVAADKRMLDAVDGPTPEDSARSSAMGIADELNSGIVVASSVEPAVVPRRVSAKPQPKTEFESILQKMIADKRQGPQLVKLHGRIIEMMPHAGSCGLVAVQRDAHVAELLVCVGSLHAAAGDNHVLLVDANADLRRLTDGFRLGLHAGLSDVCTGACKWNSAVHPTSTEKLSVMPVGTTTDLIADWSIVESILKAASRQYALVLVDMGQAHGEAVRTIAAACDRVLVHVHLGKTHREMARNVIDYFFSNNLTVSGVVVTNVPAGL